MRDARHGHARNAFCLLTRCARVSPSQTPRWNRGLGLEVVLLVVRKSCGLRATVLLKQCATVLRW